MGTAGCMRCWPDKGSLAPCAPCNGCDAGQACKSSARPCGPSARRGLTQKSNPKGVNDVWCLDLAFDTTQRGTTVKFLTLLDEYSHYALDIVASHRMGSREVVAALQSGCRT